MENLRHSAALDNYLMLRDKFYEFREKFDRSWDFNKSYNDYYDKLYNAKEYKEYLEAARLEEQLRPITYRTADKWEYECRIPKNDFIKSAKTGLFTGYDGTGYYGKENEISNIPADPDEIYKGNICEGFDYVWWYNK